MFAALAEQTIKCGGFVVGVLFDDNLHPIMKLTSDIDEIRKMQGSKYVQANTGYVFREIKERLELGNKVLFTGTPCQVVGLKSFLSFKNYPNLLTVDFVCHGTPNEAFFNKFIEFLEQRKKGKIVDYQFRSKKNGWGQKLNCISIKKTNGSIRKKYFYANEEFYTKEFLKGNISRPSCFSCKFACEKRVSDITMCDFWGCKKAGVSLDPSKGISAVLINTPKGEDYISSSHMNLEQVDPRYIIEGNGNLQKPTIKGEKWDYYMGMYKNGSINACFESFQIYNKREIVKLKIERLFFAKAYYILRIAKHRFIK